MGGGAVVSISVDRVVDMDACEPVDVDSDGAETVSQAVATINSNTTTATQEFFRQFLHRTTNRTHPFVSAPSKLSIQEASELVTIGNWPFTAGVYHVT